jgi:hypothetical protein
MTDNTTQLVNQAQDATRSMHQTIQDLMGVQSEPRKNTTFPASR